MFGLKKPTRKLEIIAIHNDKELDPDVKQRLLCILTPRERQKNERFLRWQDAQSNLLGRIAIRSMILERFGIEPEDISFATNDYGKPYVEGIKDFHFNISHSNEWVVIVGNNSQVGIDIEKICTVDLEIAEQFFSMKEYEMLAKKSLDLRKIFFYDLWTLKESYIKADGRGLYIPLNSFSIVDINNSFHVVGAQKNYHFKQYEFDRNYKLSVCALTDEFPEKVNVKGIQTFIKPFLNQISK